MNKEQINAAKQQIHLLCVMWAPKAIITQSIDEYTLTLKNIDPKVLYMTARPSKNRAFITTEKFMTTWQENEAIFEKEPPEIAISYSNMPLDSYGVAEAISIVLCNPKRGNETHSWIFQLKFLSSTSIKPGSYDEIALFIDWLPSFECPLPIKLILPTLLPNS